MLFDNIDKPSLINHDDEYVGLLVFIPLLHCMMKLT